MPRLVVGVPLGRFGTTLGGCWAIGSAIWDRKPIPSPAAPRWPPVQPQTGGHGRARARAVGVSVVAVIPPTPGAGGPSGTPIPCMRPA